MEDAIIVIKGKNIITVIKINITDQSPLFEMKIITESLINQKLFSL